jgi:hypothetical protein
MPNAPRPTAVRLTAPGLTVAGAVPLVPDFRSLELSPHPLLEALRPRTGPVAQEALALTEALAAALPAEIAAPPAPQVPSLWECARYEFARYSLAPALLNLEIAQAALAAAPGADLALLERPRSGWWLGGSGAEEAAREAACREGRRLRLSPGALPRGLRRALQFPLARRAPRGVTHCDSCAVLPAEAPGDTPTDVLFFGMAATSVPILARLSPALEAAGLSCAVLDLHLDRSTEALRRTALRVVDGRPRLYGGEAAAAQARARCATWRREMRGGLRRLVASGAFPAWLAPVAERRLTLCLARDLPALAAHRQAAQVLLDALRPRLVVGLHFLSDFLAPALFSAQACGARSAWHQHGIRGPVHRGGVVFPWGELLAWGQYTADLYADLVPPGSRWTVTGNCLYDDLLRTPPPAPEPIRARLGLGARPVVLVTTQTDEAQIRARQERWWLQGVAEACRALGALLVIKLHPHEREGETYAGLLAAFPETVRLFRHGELDLREGLAVAAVLVLRDSTVAYEAALLGKPVVTVTLAPDRPRFPLAEHGGALGVSRYEDLEPVLREVLSGAAETALAERRAAFLEYHLGPPDGHATDRLVVAIQRIVEGP